MTDPDFIVFDALPPGMRLVHTSRVFADEPNKGFIVDAPDFEIELDDDDEIRATRT
jgi:hypothetical protein